MTSEVDTAAPSGCPMAAAATSSAAAEGEQPNPAISRSASTNSTSSELHRTLDTLNLNAPSTLHRAVPPTAAGFRPPSAVAWLVGIWKGKGKGIFPTIKDFDYMEESSFDWDEKNPRPLLFYRQQTFSTKGYPPKPMHAESGYIRVIAIAGTPICKIEWIVTAPNGVCTVEEGTVEGNCIKLRLTSTVRSTTARPPFVTGLERTYWVDPSATPPTLHYVVDMSTTKTPLLTRHLEGFLTKWEDDEDGSDEHDGPGA